MPVRVRLAIADTDEERVRVMLKDVDAVLVRDTVADAVAIEGTLAEPEREPDTERVIVVEVDLDLLRLADILEDGDPATLAP